MVHRRDGRANKQDSVICVLEIMKRLPRLVLSSSDVHSVLHSLGVAISTVFAAMQSCAESRSVKEIITL